MVYQKPDLSTVFACQIMSKFGTNKSPEIKQSNKNGVENKNDHK